MAERDEFEIAGLGPEDGADSDDSGDAFESDGEPTSFSGHVAHARSAIRDAAGHFIAGGGSGVRTKPRKRARRSDAGKPRKSKVVAGDAAPEVTVSGTRTRAAAPKAIIPAQAFAPLIGFAFSMLAARRGRHWMLAPEELDAASGAVANAFRHLPIPQREMGIAADIAAIGVVAASIVLPRVQVDAQIRAGAYQTGPQPQSGAPLAGYGASQNGHVEGMLESDPLPSY